MGSDGLEISVLGPAEVRVDGAPVTLGGRARALLLALAVRCRDPVPPDTLVEVVWPADAPSTARNTLQATVSRLRRTLGAAGDAVVQERGAYRLDVPDNAVDAARFEAAVATARPLVADDPATAERLLADGLASWRGEPYQDAAEDPAAVAAASRLEELRLEAVELWARAALAAGGDGAEVVAATAAEARAHPTREGLQRVHAHALYLAGRQDAALDVLGTLERRLREDLGLDPDPRTGALQRAILEHDPRLRPTPPEPAAPRRDLPTPRTSFVGREDELADLRDRLPTTRVTTLVGPGGTGKSRLALEVARAWEDAGHPVAVVELAEVAAPDDVLPAVAAALGLPAHVPAVTGQAGAPGQGPLEERLVTHLSGVDGLLVVLDNCEHLVDRAAAAVDLLVGGADVRVLATSREGLRVDGEALVALPPLALPPPDADGRPDELLDFEAVALFVDRARAVDPGFTLDEATAPAVVEICRRLDGLPLALELAAARVATVPVDLLAARLSDRFRLLTGGHRTVARQRTLEAVVAWSYDLLDARQRTVLRRLGVFAGAPAVEVAEVVCAGDDLAPDEVLAVLADLADKSLLELVDDAGATRVRLLETIRDFAQTRLAGEDDAEVVRDRHAATMAERAGTAGAGLRGPGQLDWVACLDREHDDLRAALAWLIERQPDRALAVARSLTWFWWLHDHAGEGAGWLEQALHAVGESGPPESAPAWAWLGFLRLFAVDGDVEAIRAAVETCRRLLDRHDDALPAVDRAEALLALAFLEFVTVGEEAAESAAQEAESALEAAAAVGEQWLQSAAHFVRAAIAVRIGDHDLGVEHAEQALALAARTGDRWARYQSLDLLASVHNQQGDHHAAAADLEAAVELATELGAVEQARVMRALRALQVMLDGDLDAARAELDDLLGDEPSGVRMSQGVARLALGRVLEQVREPEAAVASFQAAVDHFLARGALNGAEEALAGVAFVRAGQGDGDAAAGALDAALALVPDTGPLGTTLPLLVEAGAAVALAQGDPELALRRLGRAEALRGTTPLVAAERWHVDRIEADARAQLEPAAADAALAAGRDQTGLLPPAD